MIFCDWFDWPVLTRNCEVYCYWFKVAAIASDDVLADPEIQ